jgi:hypothetical protein
MGVKPGLTKLGDIPWSQIWQGCHRVMVGEPKCWQRCCNVTFSGATSPMMYFTTMSDKRYWAVSTLRGWGRGTVAFSTHPTVISLWHQKGIDKIADQLFAHEACWHLGANTYDESGQWPFTQKMIDRWVKHYGKPIVKVDEKPRQLELKESRGWVMNAGNRRIALPIIADFSKPLGSQFVLVAPDDLIEGLE